MLGFSPRVAPVLLHLPATEPGVVCRSPLGDAAVTCVRASPGLYIDAAGVLRTAQANESLVTRGLGALCGPARTNPRLDTQIHDLGGNTIIAETMLPTGAVGNAVHLPTMQDGIEIAGADHSLRHGTVWIRHHDTEPFLLTPGFGRVLYGPGHTTWYWDGPGETNPQTLFHDLSATEWSLIYIDASLSGTHAFYDMCPADVADIWMWGLDASAVADMPVAQGAPRAASAQTMPNPIPGASDFAIGLTLAALGDGGVLRFGNAAGYSLILDLTAGSLVAAINTSEGDQSATAWAYPAATLWDTRWQAHRLAIAWREGVGFLAQIDGATVAPTSQSLDVASAPRFESLAIGDGFTGAVRNLRLARTADLARAGL